MKQPGMTQSWSSDMFSSACGAKPEAMMPWEAGGWLCDPSGAEMGDVARRHEENRSRPARVQRTNARPRARERCERKAARALCTSRGGGWEEKSRWRRDRR